MDTPKVFESEYRFCQILWDNEPLKSQELVKLCQEKLGWRHSTTYTVIKRLSQRGVLKNENTIVSSLVSREQVQAAEIDELVDKRFDGSLPAFIAAFSHSQRLSDEELAQMQRLIDSYKSREK